MDETKKTYTQEEVDELVQAEKERVNKSVALLQEENQRMIDETIAEIQNRNKPPTDEEINKLLSLEYAEFAVSVRVKGEMKPREFKIVELPQSIERKFVAKLKDKVMPQMRGMLVKLKTMMEGELDKQADLVVEFLEPLSDAMNQAVAIILDPYEEDKTITPEWVKENISSSRQWNIILAQERANRMRDFFSRVSLASIGETMTGVRSQQ